MQNALLVGGTGFVGQQLGIALAKLNFKMTVLVRDVDATRGQLAYPATLKLWDGQSELDPQLVSGFDLIVNLAGAPILGKRWTKKYKKEIWNSRVGLTELLSAAIVKAKSKPKVYVQSSAVGIYGDREAEALHEYSVPGHDYLADLARAWESASEPIKSANIRRCIFRFGLILGTTGGALEQLLPLYLKRLGARVGSGKQWVSWIHIDDVVGLITTAVQNEKYEGVFNTVAPNPVQFREFHSTLSRTVGRTNPWIAPSPLMKTILGEAAVVALSSQNCQPSRALDLGYEFQFPVLSKAFSDLIPSVHRRCHVLVRQQWFPQKPAEIWEFFSSEKNLEKITPSSMNFRVTDKERVQLKKGALINYKLRVRGLPIRWRTLIASWEPPVRFTDVQLKGPYKVWHHEHEFTELGGGTLMTDTVHYKMRFEFFSSPTIGPLVGKDIEKIFKFRSQTIARLFNKS